MQQIIAIILSIFGILGANIFYHPQANGVDNFLSPVARTQSTVTVALPVTIDIPSINIHTHIEPVGLDKHNAMDVPKNPDNVSWYKYSVRPGEIGSAVMSGHYDTATSAAVFYPLRTLTIGDTVSVTDQKGAQYNFKVTDIQTYDFDKLPLKFIHERNDTARLNLITCAGTFDEETKNYSQRLVIYTELVK